MKRIAVLIVAAVIVLITAAAYPFVSERFEQLAVPISTVAVAGLTPLNYPAFAAAMTPARFEIFYDRVAPNE